MLAVIVATIPVAAGLLPDRIFHIRDLSLFFWCRHLWLRRTLLSGEWPLWDPFAGAGQSAVADALHQMFLLPSVLLRLIGSERLGFNLWIMAPFPIAALGMYRYLRLRFSTRAAALGATVFAVSGPVVSSGNFPNLSWSVAWMPWVLWSVDRCHRDANPARQVVLVSTMFALQALAGEPVSLAATAVLAVAQAAVLEPSEDLPWGWRDRFRGTARGLIGLALGGLVAAIQLLPLADAVAGSWRSAGSTYDFWSLHPLGLAESISVHLFGDYFVSQNFRALPWMTPLNSGRDPFFFSIYIGPTVLAMAVFGAVAGWSRRWAAFWLAAGAMGIVCAAGPHTPLYPAIRSHLPLVESFRFPVKYLLVAVVAVAALAASAWDAIHVSNRRQEAPRRYLCARVTAVVLLLAIAAVGYGLAAASLYWLDHAARAFYEVAAWIGVADPVAGAGFMIGTLPGAMTRLVLLALAGALFIGVASSARAEARLASVALFLLLVTDLVAAAWGINPTTSSTNLDEPQWISAVREDPQSRFYFGGKIDGTLDPQDPDGARAFIQPFDMMPAEVRSAISNQAVFYPAGRGVREIFSYDLAVLWPRSFQLVHQRFLRGSKEERERLLDRVGARYRLLWSPAAGGRQPVVTLPYYRDTGLFDYGPKTPRASIATRWAVQEDLRTRIEHLFAPETSAETVILAAPPPDGTGVSGPPESPGARIVQESSNEVVVEAAVGEGGGLLRLLDSYSADWHVTVDGSEAPLLQADVLFRAVALVPGRHKVVFRYRPAAFYRGAAVSSLALIACVVLVLWGKRRTPRPLVAREACL